MLNSAKMEEVELDDRKIRNQWHIWQSNEKMEEIEALDPVGKEDGDVDNDGRK